MAKSDSRKNNIERYDLQRSPFSQRPTQRDVAALLGETRDDLRRLVNYKEQFIIRRPAETGKNKKIRNLAYPDNRLRAVHERLKFHFGKIIQPDYLISPRKYRSQRDNALLHLDNNQYLTLDLKKFYPSTTREMVVRWFIDELGMYPDVAGLLSHLCTVDDVVSLGSPFTPVLCSLVHRNMFNAIDQECNRRDLQYSVWVDDLTVSGTTVPGDFVDQVRNIVRVAGLRSHKIRYLTGSRPVFITGIGVVGRELVAPNALNLKIRDAWQAYHRAQTTEEREAMGQRLLTLLGTLRYISGASSAIGRKASDQMNAVRQRRTKISKEASRIASEVRKEWAASSPVDRSLAPF